MSTNWLIRFVDGSVTLQRSDTIQQAMDAAATASGKHVRSACYHSSYQCNETLKWDDPKWGYGFGEIAQS